MTTEPIHPPKAVIEHASADTPVLRLTGTWRIGEQIPTVDEVERQLLAMDDIEKIYFDTAGLSGWDSQFLVFLTDLKQKLAEKQIELDAAGLPEGVVNILTIASAVPEKTTSQAKAPHKPFFVSMGEDAIAFFRTVSEMLAFIGSAVLALIRLLTGKAGFRRVDFVSLLRECGADALPIVSLISLLVGLILAFVGRGAADDVRGPDLRGRVWWASPWCGCMGAVMAGIIMAGRTGCGLRRRAGHHAGQRCAISSAYKERYRNWRKIMSDSGRNQAVIGAFVIGAVVLAVVGCDRFRRREAVSRKPTTSSMYSEESGGVERRCAGDFSRGQDR